jgi:CheY-like chemotaxis protein
VLDDNRVMRTLLTAIVESLGCTVTTAASGQAALDCCAPAPTSTC